MERRLQILDFLLPMVKVMKEKFIRGCEYELNPEKVFEQEFILSGDENQALVAKSWQKLNQN
jgi:hypothetical protein